jgi:hypothetical protein
VRVPPIESETRSTEIIAPCILSVRAQSHYVCGPKGYRRWSGARACGTLEERWTRAMTQRFDSIVVNLAKDPRDLWTRL